MKNLLITGGSQGIGLSICETYLKEGYAVYNLDIKKPEKEMLDDHYHFIKYDVSTYNEVEDVRNNLPDIDILILNAAMYDKTPFLRQSIAEMKDIIDVNLIGHIALAKTYASSYKGKSGRIIIITSTRAYMSEENTIGYSVSKGALTSLVHALAVTLQKNHITVNGVAPGWINSHNEKVRDIDEEFHLSKRIGKTNDIARVCLFLSNPSNDFINGEIITVDGGVTKTMIYPE